ncbi:hypothetical protein PBY51_014023 [Eleginops maclovinus]|uniref:Uncharacterized protein n=1 Tax=Eleginops maclovinus TaxID=56733 RepID=A0AAN7WVV3_ELEMC|nr:hypothetical protein PBY51_014023 [Eleginops maclovinus]
MWLRDILRRGRVSFSRSSPGTKTQPCIVRSRLPPPLLRDKETLSEFQVRCMCSEYLISSVGWGCSPEFNQHWKIRGEGLQHLHGSLHIHHCLLLGSARTHGSTGGVTYGIWGVCIRFCSWLQQWDDEWFFTSVLRRQTVEPT